MKWEEINLSNLKTSYMATVINMMLSHRSMEKIENSEIDPHKYVRMIFDKDIKAIQWRKDSLTANVAGTIGYPWANRNELQPKFTLYIVTCQSHQQLAQCPAGGEGSVNVA